MDSFSIEILIFFFFFSILCFTYIVEHAALLLAYQSVKSIIHIHDCIGAAVFSFFFILLLLFHHSYRWWRLSISSHLRAAQQFPLLMRMPTEISSLIKLPLLLLLLLLLLLSTGQANHGRKNNAQTKYPLSHSQLCTLINVLLHIFLCLFAGSVIQASPVTSSFMWRTCSSIFTRYEQFIHHVHAWPWPWHHITH